MRLAIVAVNAYPAIVPQAGKTVGGLETFAWSLARTLARDPAIQVQFVVRHSSRPDQREVDGVELLCEVETLRPVRQAVSRDVEVMTQVPWLRIKRFRPGLLWQVPLLHVYGDADEVVPWDENTGLIAEPLQGPLRRHPPDLQTRRQTSPPRAGGLDPDCRVH